VGGVVLAAKGWGGQGCAGRPAAGYGKLRVPGKAQLAVHFQSIVTPQLKMH
jgi:hypothetical protein